mgnify:CR=1 FL=1
MLSATNKKQLMIISSFSVIVLLFNIWLLPLFDVTVALKNICSLDLLSSYQLSDINKLFTTIGEEGILQYKIFLIIDTLYLFTYTILAVYILTYLLNNIGRLGKIIYKLRWFPLVVGLLDMIENTNTLILLKNFPHISEVYANFGSFITAAKWYCVSVLAGIIICFTFYMILRNIFWRLKNQFSKQL